MFWNPYSLCVVLVFFIGTCMTFPMSDSKNDLKEIVSSIIERNHEKEVDGDPQVPPEVTEDATEQDRKLGASFGGDEKGMEKRAPWYSSRAYFDGSKRFGGFDSINHYSNFGKFQKRKQGESEESFIDRLKRAAFDSIHHYSDFGRFSKRSVDRATFARGYADQPYWKRRAFDSIHHYSDFGRFNRRK